FHAQSGLRRGYDVTVLPFDLFLEQPGVKAVPLLEGFKNEEIRQGHGKLYVGRANDRPAIAVRRYLYLPGFRHGRDLLCLQQTTGAAEIRLQYRGRAILDDACELELGRQTFAGRNGNACAASYLCHHFRHVWRYRLLEPKRVVGLDCASHAKCARCRELAMRAKQYVDLRSYRLASRLEHPSGKIEVFHTILI